MLCYTPAHATCLLAIYILDSHDSLHVNGLARTGVIIHNTTRRSQRSRVASVISSRHIDTHSNPSENTILKLVTKQRILKDRVRVAILRLILNNVVIRVLRDRNIVRVVRIRSLNLGDQVLVKEQLSNMRHMTTSNGVILERVRAHMRNDVHVRRATVVVTRENGLELRNTIGAGLLNTTEEGLVEVRSVVAVTVHAALHARVLTGGVAGPHIPVQVLDGLAGLDVDKLTVHNERDTRLAVADVRADELALHPEGADFALGGEDADGVVGEELRLRGVGGHLEGGVVGGVDDAVRITGVEQRALAVGLGDGGTAGSSAGVDASALENVSASAQAALGVVQEVLLCRVGYGALFMGAGVGD